MSTWEFEKLQYIPENLEGCMYMQRCIHTQRCMNAQGRPKMAIIIHTRLRLQWKYMTNNANFKELVQESN